MDGVLEDDGAGGLLVHYQYPQDGAPKVTHLWWRVVRTTGTGYGERPKAGDIATANGGGGIWGTHDPAIRRSTGSVYIPGSDKAVRRETTDVPPPKVRRGVELRWHRGQWEKLLKRGWAPA